jgi:hypothetical protein
MCLNGVLVPHRLPHPRIHRGAAGFPGVRVECGGDVVRAALGTTRLLKVINKVGEHCEGGRPSGLSSPREIGGFCGAFESRELPPWSVPAQFRAGRQGRDPDREDDDGSAAGASRGG